MDWAGSERLSWRDLLVIVRNAPRSSQLHRTHVGDAAEWGVNELLAANMVDLLQNIVWQNGGGKGPRPKPIPRPTVPHSAEVEPQDGPPAVSIEDMEAHLRAKNPSQH